MADEYIKREKTLALLKSLGSRDYRREKGTIQEAIKMISSAVYTPAADVAPVVHGQWEMYTDEYGKHARCSVCGDEFACLVTSYTITYYRPNYCPTCGTRMDGGEDRAGC